jgi:hypothetical protein
VDLVCTKGILLYKSQQVWPNVCWHFLFTFCLLFITVWKLIKGGQMQPNAAKRKGLLLMLRSYCFLFHLFYFCLSHFIGLYSIRTHKKMYLNSKGELRPPPELLFSANFRSFLWVDWSNLWYSVVYRSLIDGKVFSRSPPFLAGPSLTCRAGIASEAQTFVS